MHKNANTFASYITPPLVIPLLVVAIVVARAVYIWN
jgi:hypothetical protein